MRKPPKLPSPYSASPTLAVIALTWELLLAVAAGVLGIALSLVLGSPWPALSALAVQLLAGKLWWRRFEAVCRRAAPERR